MKNYLINIILLIIEFLLLLFIKDIPIDVGLTLLITLIISVVSYNLNIEYFKKKKYLFGDLFKTSISSILFIIGLIYLIISLNKPSFGSLSYSIICYIMALMIIINTIVNILIKVFYWIIKHQKLDFKNNRVFTIIQILLFIICLIFFF